MSFVVTITSQGQISIPAKIRRELGLVKTKKAIVSVQNGNVLIEPSKDLLDIAGSIKSAKKPLTGEKLHDLFAKSVAQDYAKKIKNEEKDR